MAEKARYFCAILYPENMIKDWQNQIGDILQIPCCYIIHDKDYLTYAPSEDEEYMRKVHVHVLFVFSNTTTLKHAKDTINRLSRPGAICCSTVQIVIDIRHMFNYLIHDTEACKKAGKYLYKSKERNLVNSFDIGMYEQISQDEKLKMLDEITDFVIKYEVTNFTDMLLSVKANFEPSYYKIVIGYQGFLNSVIRGNYHKFVEKEEKESKK